MLKIYRAGRWNRELASLKQPDSGRSRRSPEDQGFDAPCGDGQDCFDYTEHSHFVANTYADIHYFQKDPTKISPKLMSC